MFRIEKFITMDEQSRDEDEKRKAKEDGKGNEGKLF